MASLRWSPDEDTQDAIAALVQSMRDGLPDLLQMAEFIQGCEVYDLNPYGVGLGAFPRFIQVHLRGEYITDVRYRDNLGLAVGDICIVVRFREGEQYEVFSVGGTAGGGGGRWPGEAYDPHGFENRIDSAIGFVNGTRTFAITGGAYKFWSRGTEFIGAGDSDVLPAFTDWYFYYYDIHGALNRITSPTLSDSHTLVAYVFWNNILSEGILFEERHGISMDYATHFYLHNTIGARVVRGFAIGGYTLSPAVPADADNTYSFTFGYLADEDIELYRPALPDNGPYTVWHRTGAAGVWTWSTGLVLPFEYTIAGYIEYNQWTGATWQLTQLTAAKYVNYFVFVTMAVNAEHKCIMIPGQAVWDNLDDASNETIGSMALGEFPAIESGTLYRITYRTSNGYGSTGKCRIELVTNLTGGPSVYITQYGAVISHATLPDRDLPNQHPAESISLHTAFNEPGADVDFRVEGTGDVNLILVDAGTDRVGIGQLAPETKLQVNGQIMAWNTGTDEGQFLGPNVLTGASVLGMLSPGGAIQGSYFQANGKDFPGGNQFGRVYIVADDRNAHANAGQIRFSQLTGGTRMMIDKSGNIGIGTTILSAKLDVRGNAANVGGLVNIGKGNLGGYDATIAGGWPAGVTMQPMIDISGNTNGYFGGYMFAGANLQAGVTLTSLYGMFVETPSKTGPGTITTAYGLRVNNPTIGSTNVGAALLGNVGINTLAPGQIFDVNQGSGNMIADGYDLHSLAEYKEELGDIDTAKVLEDIIAIPPQQWKRTPFVSTVELVHAAWKHFDISSGKEPRQYLKDLEDGEILDWINAKRIALREERRTWARYQRFHYGLVADDEDTISRLPEVVSRNPSTDEPDGISLGNYVGALHASIIALEKRVRSNNGKRPTNKQR